MSQKITSASIFSKNLESESYLSHFSSAKRPISIQIDRLPTDSLCSPATPLTPVHPFENEIMAPLQASFKLLDGDLDQASVREQLRIKAEEMLEFIGSALERARKTPREDEERKYQGDANAQNEIRVDYLIHELRTPLSAIVGILDNFESALKEDLRTAYHHLYKTAELMHSDEVALILIIKAFQLQTLIDEVRSTTDKIDSRVSIQFNCPSGDLIVKGDLQKLKQILINLVSNAIKHSPKPGEVVVQIYPAIQRNKALISFQVIDQGPGMSEEVQSRLFIPFSKGEPATESSLPSTGLGLFLSQKFANIMKGKIQVICPGKGSIFFFDLYLEKGAKVDLVPSPFPASAVRKITKLKKPDISILWAEDERVSQKVFRTMLKKAGHNGKLNMVCNGEEAVNEMREFPDGYDVVILDHNMPQKGGWGAAQEIHQFSRIPIILVSAISDGERSEICREAVRCGMNFSVLTKPARIEDLARRINLATQSCFNT